MKKSVIGISAIIIGILSVLKLTFLKKEKNNTSNTNIICENSKANNDYKTIVNTSKKSKSNIKKRKNKRFFQKVISASISLLIAPVITAFIADKIIRKSMQEITKENTLNNQLSTLDTLYIGCSKEWLDERLGVPTFIYSVNSENLPYYVHNDDLHSDLLGCVYVTDIAILRAFFNKDDRSCKAFFVTAKDETIKIKLPNPYRRSICDKSLGDFSYYDIKNMPSLIGGFITNGVGRIFYGECFYYASGGNYYNFSFGTLDYGLNGNFNLITMNPDEFEFDDKVNKGHCKVISNQFSQDRSQCFPNTYGISTLSYSYTWYLLADYSSFDSNQLRIDAAN